MIKSVARHADNKAMTRPTFAVRDVTTAYMHESCAKLRKRCKAPFTHHTHLPYNESEFPTITSAMLVMKIFGRGSTSAVMSAISNLFFNAL